MFCCIEEEEEEEPEKKSRSKGRGNARNAVSKTGRPRRSTAGRSKGTCKAIYETNLFQFKTFEHILTGFVINRSIVQIHRLMWNIPAARTMRKSHKVAANQLNADEMIPTVVRT